MNVRSWNADRFVKLIVVCGSVLIFAFFAFSATSNGASSLLKNAQSMVTREDTLAQWLMALFSLLALIVSGIAVYWVRETLVATRQMVDDTRMIGEAQVRAYIYANEAEIDASKNMIALLFRNFGNSPGSISFVDCYVWVDKPYENQGIWSQKFWSDGWTIAPQATFRQEFRLDAGRADFLQQMINEAGVSVSVHGTFQSVDVFKRTHLHGIHIVLSDGILRN